MTFRAGIAALFLLGVCSMPAMSANPKCDPGPSQADIDACTPEVYAHCNDYIPDQEAITKCLKKNIALLKPACHKVMSRPFAKLPRCDTRAGNN